MPRRLTTEEVVRRFKEIHCDKYDYSEVRYINAKTKVKIICKNHGYFYQSPDKHKTSGCPKCVGMNKSTKDVVKEFKSIHDDRYDYSLVKYNKSANKVKIICRKHGIFLQSHNTHVQGHGCPNCGFESTAEKQKSSNEYFIKKAIEVHGIVFDYSESNYSGWRRKLKIICRDHGEYLMTPVQHIQFKKGCPFCRNEEKRLLVEKSFIKKSKKKHSNRYLYDSVKYVKSNKKVLIRCKKHGLYSQTPSAHLMKAGSGCPRCAGRNKTTEEVVNEFKSTHGDRYDYSLVEYQKSNKKVKVVCRVHGLFLTTVSHHKCGRGCPRCKASQGENSISIFLSKMNIEFIFQYSIKEMCRRYIIDFYLPDYNLFIEYHGKQHYERIPFWHRTKKAFKYQQQRDQKLRDLCTKRGIELLEIGYFDFDNIESILQERLRGAKSHRHPIQLKLALNVA